MPVMTEYENSEEDFEEYTGPMVFGAEESNILPRFQRVAIELLEYNLSVARLNLCERINSYRRDVSAAVTAMISSPDIKRVTAIEITLAKEMTGLGRNTRDVYIFNNRVDKTPLRVRALSLREKLPELTRQGRSRMLLRFAEGLGNMTQAKDKKGKIDDKNNLRYENYNNKGLALPMGFMRRFVDRTRTFSIGARGAVFVFLDTWMDLTRYIDENTLFDYMAEEKVAKRLVDDEEVIDLDKLIDVLSDFYKPSL